MNSQVILGSHQNFKIKVKRFLFKSYQAGGGGGGEGEGRTPRGPDDPTYSCQSETSDSIFSSIFIQQT